MWQLVKLSSYSFVGHYNIMSKLVDFALHEFTLFRLQLQASFTRTFQIKSDVSVLFKGSTYGNDVV